MSFLQRLEKLGLPCDTERTHSYVLTDLTAERRLLARLEFHDVAHRPLWRLDKQAGLEKYSPWLFQVERDSDFDRWLGEVFDATPLTVLFARPALDTVWKHLRRHNKFEEAGQRYFLRMGDPSALHLYTASIAHNPLSVGSLFADGAIEEMFFHDPHKALSSRVQPLFEQQHYAGVHHDGCLVWADLPAQEPA